MIKKGLLFLILKLTVTLFASGQNLNLDKYDVSINDSLISKSDFIKNGKSLDSSRLKQLTFNPIVDGIRKVYYLNGKLHSAGEIKNQKEEGFWTFVEQYYKSGQLVKKE